MLSKGNVERNGKTLYLPLYATFALPHYLGEEVTPQFKLQIWKSELGEKIGLLSDGDIEKLNEALKTMLALS